MLNLEVQIFTLEVWTLTLEVCRLTLEVWTFTTEQLVLMSWILNWSQFLEAHLEHGVILKPLGLALYPQRLTLEHQRLTLKSHRLTLLVQRFTLKSVTWDSLPRAYLMGSDRTGKINYERDIFTGGEGEGQALADRYQAFKIHHLGRQSLNNHWLIIICYQKNYLLPKKFICYQKNYLLPKKLSVTKKIICY